MLKANERCGGRWARASWRGRAKKPLIWKTRMGSHGDRWRIFLRTEKSGEPVFLPIPGILKDALDRLPVTGGAGVDCRFYFWKGVTSERSIKGIAERTHASVFKASKVPISLATLRKSSASITPSGPLPARPALMILWIRFMCPRVGKCIPPKGTLTRD